MSDWMYCLDGIGSFKEFSTPVMRLDRGLGDLVFLVKDISKDDWEHIIRVRDINGVEYSVRLKHTVLQSETLFVDQAIVALGVI